MTTPTDASSPSSPAAVPSSAATTATAATSATSAEPPPLALAPRRLVASVADDRATLVVTGSERVSWLNGLVTCDLKKLDEGTGAYGLVVGKTGKIQADVAIVSRGDALFVSVPAAREEALLAMFDTYLVMEDAEVLPAAAGAEGAMFVRLVGPEATTFDTARLASQGDGVFASVALPWFDTGGRALVVERANVDKVLDELRANGVEVVDQAAWAALCVTYAVPRYGVDFDEKLYPQEAGLEKRAVSFSKGCYLGQEVVHTLEIRGRANRRLTAFEIEAPREAVDDLAGAALTADGTPIGTITSATENREREGFLWALGVAKLAPLATATELRAGDFRVLPRQIG